MQNYPYFNPYITRCPGETDFDQMKTILWLGRAFIPNWIYEDNVLIWRWY